MTKNGMTVILLERKALPFITASISVKAGSVFEKEELAGLANITADLLTEGTSTRSASQISEEEDFIGASLSSSGGGDSASASLRVLTKDREKGFELLSDILINPSFPDAEIERAKSQIKAGIISKLDDPATIAAEAFNKNLFGNHPYSRPLEGTVDSLDKIKKTHIVDFHSQFYRPNNTILTVVGDINLRSLKKLLHRYFGKWKRGDITFTIREKAAPLKKKKVEIIHKDITQANVQLGHLGLKRSDPDFYAAYVMNYILGGGGFVSRLMTEIRDNQGLVYGVYSYFNALKEVGPFKVGLQTKNESAKEAVEEVRRQIRELVNKGVTEKELRDAKDYIIGSFPLKFTTNQKIANYLSYIERHKLGLDYLDKFPEIIEALTVKDINEAAKEYLDPDNYLLVIVGNKEKVGKIE